MPSIQVRKPFAAAFAILLLAAAYLGLSTQKIPQYGHSDKGLHFVTFFILTIAFYWILETSRRRLIHLTLIVCTAGLAIGSEFAQSVLPNGRNFDPYDIVANVVGSTLALLLCSWYHKRMLERRRKNKHYDVVPGDEEFELDADAERDVELGHALSTGQQESGVTDAATSAAAAKATDVTEELDNWDENAEDWEEEADDGDKSKDVDTKKRSD